MTVVASRDRRRVVTHPLTHDEWVQAALDARIEQGFPAEIEDPDVIDFLVGVFSRAARSADGPTAA
jgi:hypothetical protein